MLEIILSSLPVRQIQNHAPSWWLINQIKLLTYLFPKRLHWGLWWFQGVNHKNKDILFSLKPTQIQIITEYCYFLSSSMMLIVRSLLKTNQCEDEVQHKSRSNRRITDYKSQVRNTWDKVGRKWHLANKIDLKTIWINVRKFQNTTMLDKRLQLF